MSLRDTSPTDPTVVSLTSSNSPKFGTPVPNRIFVGGIVSNTTEEELKAFFSAFGSVKDTKIITDRGGVSRGYGFVTFETQEDAEKIIKKDADNLIFKDRKLNIGPAVRKQQNSQRSLADIANVSPGIMFTNGVPYTYQNGTAIFQLADSTFPTAVHQPQSPYSALMLPQPQPVYIPQYPTHYQQAIAPHYATGLRWTPQGATQTLAGSPGYIYPTIHTSPDIVYASAAQTYSTELPEAILDNTPVEGMICVDHLSNTRSYAGDQTQALDHSSAGQKTTAAMFPMQGPKRLRLA